MSPHLRSFDRIEVDDVHLEESEIDAARHDEQPFEYAVSCERILDRASRDEMAEVEFVLDGGGDDDRS